MSGARRTTSPGSAMMRPAPSGSRASSGKQSSPPATVISSDTQRMALMSGSSHSSKYTRGRRASALLAARRPDGLLGYVQGVSDRPNPVKADGTQLYATGAFLMDVCELADLAPLTVPAPPKLSIPEAEKAPSQKP